MTSSVSYVLVAASVKVTLSGCSATAGSRVSSVADKPVSSTVWSFHDWFTYSLDLAK